MMPQRQLLAAVDMFIPEGRRFYPDGPYAGQPRAKQTFTYSATFIGASVLAAGATVTVPVQIDSSMDFLAFNLNRRTTAVNNTTFIALTPATILLTTTGGGSRLMDQAQHLENMAGTGGLPGTRSWPLWLPGSSVLQVQLTNLDLANAFNVWLAFDGVALY